MTAAKHGSRITPRSTARSSLPRLPVRLALSLLLVLVPSAGRAADNLSVDPSIVFMAASRPSASGIAAEGVRPMVGLDLEGGAFDAPQPLYAGTTALSQQIVGWMVHEAQRYRQSNLFAAPGPFDPGETATDEQRAAGAERIITRALNRTFHDHLEELARTTLGLDPVWIWLEDFGDGSRNPAVAAEEPPTRPAMGTDRDSARGSIGLRVDAHPRLMLRGTFHGMRARLEIPMRNEPIRLSLTRRVGSFGQAALSAGRSPDGDDWASLGLRLRF